MTAANKMNYYTDSWPLVVDICPCDVHFTEFLEVKKISNASIFHFGTGSHHHVGIRCAENGSNNAVLGITASIEEEQAYVKLAIDRPQISRSYKCFFGDIYMLDARLLPAFDVVALFHLCEFWGPESVAYGAMSDLELAEMLIEKLRPGGLLLFYTKSMAFEKAKPVIAALKKSGRLKDAEEFKTLLVLQKT